MEKYGFMFLYKLNQDEAFKLYTCSEVLFDNMIECVQAARSHPSLDIVDHSNFELKIAYFQILTNNQIVRELHVRNVDRLPVTDDGFINESPVCKQ